MQNTLYFLGIGNAVYWSTSIVEINAFAKSFNMLGAVEEGKQVAFEIPGVICIHKFY